MNTYLNKTKFYIVLLLMATVFSCSEDDEADQKLDLVVSVSALEVEIGEKVTFEVTANGKKISDVTIHIQAKAISGYDHSFSEKGTYTITAKKRSS